MKLIHVIVTQVPGVVLLLYYPSFLFMLIRCSIYWLFDGGTIHPTLIIFQLQQGQRNVNTNSVDQKVSY
jgi:hypothetical protein